MHVRSSCFSYKIDCFFDVVVVVVVVAEGSDFVKLLLSNQDPDL